MGERKQLDRGQLSLYLAPGATRATMLRLALAAFFGRVKKDPEYTEFLVQEFQVNVPGRKLRVSLDGEVRRMAGPLCYAIQPRALKVRCEKKEPE